MTTTFTRRHLLQGSMGAATIGLLSSVGATSVSAQSAPTRLTVGTRMLEVKRRPARVFGITQESGQRGLVVNSGERFRIKLQNRIADQTVIHWHGLTPPYNQDGVAPISQQLVAAGDDYDYDFPLERPGTNWMHSHHGLQEQQLMAAPLIVRDPTEAGRDAQEVVVILHDFTFRDPNEILAELQRGARSAPHDMAAMQSGSGGAGMANMPGHAGMNMGNMPARGPVAQRNAPMDVNDVEYDAYLANDRTLDDPQVTRVERGGRVHLRIINAGASTNFWIDLGALTGELIAVDGMPVAPVQGRRFEMAIAQRLDIRLRLPMGQGAYPILARREGARERTGVVLATPNARIARIASTGEPAGVIGLDLERRLRAAQPLPDRQPDRRLTLNLTGNMEAYRWTLNETAYGQHQPLAVRAGERVELTLRNQTMMSHPMHLHGHHFQVVGIGDARLEGALRDTVNVPMSESVTIAFQANNPGRWALHCHNLYHAAVGMMTELHYA